MTTAPTKIKRLQNGAELAVWFGADCYHLSAEFLRVHSPSAEVKGHGPGQAKLQHGKGDVRIERVSPVGNYAIQLTFSDGHDSGIYPWATLQHFCLHGDALWRDYLRALEEAQLSRDPDTRAINIIKPQ